MGAEPPLACCSLASSCSAFSSLPAPADKPTLMLLDIPDDGGFYVSAETELTVDAIRGFLASYSSGALKGERQQLKG